MEPGRQGRYAASPAEDTGRFGNSHIRWTVLYALVVFAIATLPLWLSLLIPDAIAWVNAGIVLAFGLSWLVIACNALCNFGRMLWQPVVSIEAVQLARRRIFRHIVVVPCYTDPIEVLFDCLGSLLAQRAPAKLVVVVAFEARTPDLKRKVAAVRAAFEGRFGDLVFSVHAVAPEREIPGGCSNKNFALRTAYRHIQTCHEDYQAVNYTVTTCDTDSLFSPEYFEVLEACYNRESPQEAAAPRLCVWQPPLFYNWDLDQRPFFVRITGVTRAMMMLGGLISFSLNPMSIFSYPLELGLKAGFINPRYSVDDIIFKVRCMCSANEQIPVLLLPVPVISGPTIGTSWWQEVREWARQIRRWIIGSSESFHYCVTHWRGRPLVGGLAWFFLFFMYYAVLLCAAGVFSVAVAVPLPWVDYPELEVRGIRLSLKYAGAAGLLLQYVVFSIAFAIDGMAVRVLTVRERIGPHRRLAHFILAPLVLVVYGFIAFYAVLKFVFAGKRDAGHIMAAKAGLGAAAAGAVEARERLAVSAAIQAGDEEEAPVRSRSTSFTRQRCGSGQSFNRGSWTAELSGVARAVGGASFSAGGDNSEAQLCELPARFYFGETNFDPLTAPPTVGRRARVYGPV